MDAKGFRTLDDFRGLSLPRVVEWKHLDLNYKIVARIHRREMHRLRAVLHRPAGMARTSAFISTAKPARPGMVTARRRKSKPRAGDASR